MRGFYLIGAALWALPGLAVANSVHRITSTRTNQPVYEFVTASGADETDAAPGIYGEGPRGRSTLLLPGTVLGISPFNTGVLAQMPLTVRTHRSEMAVILNGRITLFSSKTRQAKPQSFIEIGSAANPVVDMNGNVFRLDMIQEINDVQMVTSDMLGDRGHLVLFSVKQKNSFGDGLTVAAFLKDPEDSDDIAFTRPPVIIDYAFQDRQQLSQLFSVAGLRVRLQSRNHIMALAQPTNRDDRVLRDWRQVVRKWANSPNFRDAKQQGSKIVEANATSNLNVARPFFDPESGSYFLEQIPTVRIAHEPYSLFQRADPFGGASSVLLFDSGADLSTIGAASLTPLVPGSIDFDTKKNQYKIYTYVNNRLQKTGSTAAIIAFVEGSPHLLYRQRDTVTGATKSFAVNLGDLIPSTVRDLHFTVTTTFDRTRNVLERNLLASYRGADGNARTIAAVIEESSGIARLSDRVFTLGRKFIDRRELEVRGFIAEVAQNQRQFFVFDPVSSAETVTNQRTLFQPQTTYYYDITASRGEKPTQVYLRTLEEAEITQRVRYIRYNPHRSETDRTGIYRKEEDGTFPNQPIVPGELLKAEGHIDYPPLDTVTIKARDSRSHEIRIRGYALNQSAARGVQARGQNKFALLGVVTARPSSEPESKAKDHVFVVDVDASFGQLTAMKMIRGKRTRENEVHILLFFRDARGKGQESSRTLRGGLASVTVDFSSPVKNGLPDSATVTRLNWITRDEVNPVLTIKQGLVFDAEGRLYFKEKPNLHVGDRHFSVRSLRDPEQRGSIYPNRGDFINLRHEEVVEDDSNSLSHLMSRWVVYNTRALFERRKELEAHVTYRKEKANSRKVQREEAANAELYEFLERLADKDAPKEHYVLMVAEDKKAHFLTTIYGRLALNPNGFFSLESPSARHLNFAIFDPASTGSELIKEFAKIRGGNRTERTVLFADLAAIVQKAGYDKASLATAESETAAASGDGTVEAEGEADAPAATATVAPEPPVMEGDDGIMAELLEDERNNREYPPFSLVSVLAAEGEKIPLKNVAEYARLRPQVPTLILATPSEWRAVLRANPRERRAQIFDTFKVNRSFLTSSWSVWAPGTEQASKEIIDYARKPITRQDFQVFPNLESILESAAKPGSAPEHLMVIVPEELKGLVNTLIYSRWATESRQFNGRWTHRNRDLALFSAKAPEGGITQEDLFNNYEAIHGAQETRTPVVIANLADIRAMGRPGERDPNNAFQIRDPAVNAAQTALESEIGAPIDDEVAEANSRRVPHAIWLMAAEGQRVQPEKSASWSVAQAAGRKVTTIVVGTEKELKELEADIGFESRFLDLRKHFKHVKLEVPSDSVKETLVTQLFASPEIAGIGYRFKVDGVADEAAKRQLIAGFVARVNQIARQNTLDQTTAFLKAFGELRRVLVESSDWRRGAVITRQHFERMFATIFNIPKNPDSLAEDDWLRRFKDIDRAAMGIGSLGYPGPIEIRRQIVERMWSVTKGVNEAITIPNSTIAIGRTSSGKTRLYRMTFKYAGLTEYNPTLPNEESRGFYWVIPVGSLTKDKEEQSWRSIHKLEEHIFNMWAIDPSAQVLFDDVHKATSREVMEWLLGFVNRLHEARGGMITVHRLGQRNEAREIPVRNLGLHMTINPNEDQNVLRRFLGNNFEKANDIYLHLIAAVTVFDNFKVEGSPFARFGAIFDMEKFPMEARVPALVMNLKKGMQSEFISDARVRLILPEVLQDLTHVFREAHARELIGNVTQTLIDLPPEIVRAPIYIRSLTERNTAFDYLNTPGLTEEASPEHLKETGGREVRLRGKDVHNYLNNQTELVAVRREAPDTLVDFVAYMLNGFRIHVYHGLLQGAQNDTWLTQDRKYREHLFPQLVTGALHNVDKFPFVPLNRVNLRPDQLGRFNQTQNDMILRRIDELSFAARDMFPIDFQANTIERYDMSGFFSNNMEVPPKKTRIDLMSETAGEIVRLLESTFEAYFRTSFRRSLPDPEAYIRGLVEGDPKEEFKQVGERLAEIYQNFTHEIRSIDYLPENRRDIFSMNNYDGARLFLMCVDRAITQMPWGIAGEFMFRVVEKAFTDQALSGRSEFQNLLFESSLSPLAPVTPDVVRQAAQASGAIKYIDADRAGRNLIRFQIGCEAMLEGARQ